jgi:hypothetical protein
MTLRSRSPILILLNGLVILVVVLLLAATASVRELVSRVLIPPSPEPDRNAGSRC